MIAEDIKQALNIVSNVEKNTVFDKVQKRSEG